jgi:hypothetical protein
MSVTTYKQLCQSLVCSEHALRSGPLGTTANTRGIIRGRGEQLSAMQRDYPEQYALYTAELLVRLSLPYDSKTVLAPIKSEVSA